MDKCLNGEGKVNNDKVIFASVQKSGCENFLIFKMSIFRFFSTLKANVTVSSGTIIQHTPPNSEIICGQNVSTKVVCGMILFFEKKAMLKI